MAKISDELLKASQNASEKYGIPTSVILGFAGLETSYGTKGMGKSKNNLFGIGNNTYSSVTESVEDFAKLVTGNKSSSQSKKYGQAVKNAQTDEEWITAITKAGYNSEYAEGVYEGKVLSVIESGNLTKYNSGKASSSSSSSSSSSGDSDLKWWGDLLVVFLCILVVGAGVVFLAFSIKESVDIDIAKGVENLVK